MKYIPGVPIYRTGEWERWFAWYPVRIETGWTWWKEVYRRRLEGMFPRYSFWQCISSSAFMIDVVGCSGEMDDDFSLAGFFAKRLDVKNINLKDY